MDRDWKSKCIKSVSEWNEQHTVFHKNTNSRKKMLFVCWKKPCYILCIEGFVSTCKQKEDVQFCPYICHPTNFSKMVVVFFLSPHFINSMFILEIIANRTFSIHIHVFAYTFPSSEPISNRCGQIQRVGVDRHGIDFRLQLSSQTYVFWFFFLWRSGKM